VVPVGGDQSTEKETRHECTEELRIGLSELLRKTRIEHDVDFLKEGVRVLSQTHLTGHLRTQSSGFARNRCTLDYAHASADRYLPASDIVCMYAVIITYL
jgi:hypothetical protein